MPRNLNYNPHLHGTHSSVLAIMSKTDGNLMPTLQMLDQYKAAPVVGELTRGGYATLGLELANKTTVGAISFGNLRTGHYNLRTITDNYTKFVPNLAPKNYLNFRDALENCVAKAFSNFDLILIYLTRARQSNCSLNHLISLPELTLLREQLQATVQFYYFIQLLGLHIFPDFTAIGNSRATLSESDIRDVIYSLLSFESITEKIRCLKIDMKSIVDNPSKENLQRALSVLDLPNRAIIKSGVSCTPKAVELTVSQFFCLADNGNAFGREGVHSFSYFASNFSSEGINTVLEKFASGKLSLEFFQSLGADARLYIPVLADRIRIFENLIAAPDENFIFAPVLQDLMKIDFPIIFISESGHIKKFSEEYRSNVPLKLGVDIPLIATNSPANRTIIRQFLNSNGGNQVQIVLFPDLERAACSGVAPYFINPDSLQKMLSKTKNHAALFIEFFNLISELNDKRNQFNLSGSQQALEALDNMLNGIENCINDTFTEENDDSSIAKFCSKCDKLINSHKNELERHRGILGVLDTALTILASLIVFYPIVYCYQQQNNIAYTFFNTDSGSRCKKTSMALNNIEHTISIQA